MPEKDEEAQAEDTSTESRDGKPRIGVYTCYCGGNISDVVDCEGVARTLGQLPDVVVSRTNMSMCSDAGQAIVEDDIRQLGLNRVVIGACSPFLHEQTFRGTLARAGLNPYFYHHVGLREQDSWATHADPAGATVKAIRLMKAGIAKARLLEALEPIHLEAQRHALVIGGGVAGLRAAWDIARRGLKVTLIEKSPFLGGRMAQLEGVFPTDQDARASLAVLIKQVSHHPNVTLFTNTQLVGLAGYVGDFQATLEQRPRGVSPEFGNLDAAIAACPVEVPDEFNYGLTNRKAIYLRYPGCTPGGAAIDWDSCTLCGACQQVEGGQAISLDRTPKTFEANVGAIVVATGFSPYALRQGEYGYGDLPEVVTLPQFIRLLALSEGKPELGWNGHPVRDVAMIHCVGSRQIEGVHEPQPDGKVNPYCSRVCCTATIHATIDLKRRFPAIHVYDIHQDIRTYGRGHEDLYRQASEDGTRFLRYLPEEGPVVSANTAEDDHALVVTVKDTLTWGETIEVPVDLAVLAVGMMPSPIDELYELLKVTPGSDRFLLEVHPKLRPVETAVNGIVLAGTAQSPMNIQESIASAGAAAAKVNGLLSGGRVELEPFVARVNPDRCQGTGACVEVCEYEGAIRLQSEQVEGQEVRRAVVSPANCVGCGVCVSACPNQAIDVQGWTLGQYRAMVGAIAAEIPQLEEVS
jgi:heterodisulfide reductase subunit A